MRSAVLKIWIKGKLKEQGKFFFLEGKPFFVFNMKLIKGEDGELRPNKLWTSYSSYSIAERIFEGLSALPSRPSCRIIANLKVKNCYWETTLADFRKYGFIQPFGNHRQRLLYLGHWQVKAGQIEEPHGLTDMELEDWKKEKSSNINSCSLKEEPKVYGKPTHDLYDLKRVFDMRFRPSYTVTGGGNL